MTKFRNISIVFSLLAILGLSSCEEDDSVELQGAAIIGPGSVYTRISESGNTTSLEAALMAAAGDLPATLDGTGPFTVFAPNNDAFTAFANEVGFATAGDLLAGADPALLAEILSYHVVPSNLEASALSDGTTLTTVSGDDLTVIVSADGAVQLQDATKVPQTNPVSTVVQGNGYADNGIVHIVDKVLVPQAAIDALNFDTRPTLLEWATGTEDLSILVSALEKAGLVDAIAELESARILAPNNEAFVDLLATLGGDYNGIDDFDNDVEIALLRDILTYHVLPSQDGSPVLTVGPATTLLEDNFVAVTAVGGGFEFGDVTAATATRVTADLDAKNGFVDIIDKVLLPQATFDFLALLGTDDLATTVIAAPQLSVLEQALVATDLVDVFVDATNAPETDETNFTYFRPATVFAPTDAAFADLFAALGAEYTSIASFDTEEELELLTEILLYHVLNGEVTSEDLEAGTETTVAGGTIEIISVVGTENFVIGDASNDVNATILTPDLQARNGVAHVVDKVLLPISAVNFINSLNEVE